MVKTPTDYFSPSCGGGGGSGKQARSQGGGCLQKVPFLTTKWASRPTVNMVKTPTDYFFPSCGGGGGGKAHSQGGLQKVPFLATKWGQKWCYLSRVRPRPRALGR